MTAKNKTHEIMSGQGYRFVETRSGLGWTAYVKEEVGCVWFVTSRDDENHAPQRMDEPVLVGKYTPRWEYIDGSERMYDSLKDFVDGKEGKVPSWTSREEG